jgi:peptidoglycan-associated lipoprotein
VTASGARTVQLIKSGTSVLEMRAMRRQGFSATALVIVSLVMISCGGKAAPVARPTPPAPPSAAGAGSGSNAGARPAAPAQPISEPTVVPPEPVRDDSIASASLDEINRNSPLRPVFFLLDSSDLSPEAQQIMNANAAVLRQYSSWVVTIEGHCDERGTAEYNLALGERRALAARAYLVSLGLPADRLRTVSYGKEFPFDPGHDEAAFAKNRRAHFVITSK